MLKFSPILGELGVRPITRFLAKLVLVEQSEVEEKAMEKKVNKRERNIILNKN